MTNFNAVANKIYFSVLKGRFVDGNNYAVALQNQIAGDDRSLVISDRSYVFNPAGLVVAAAAKDAAYAALVKQGNRIADANTAI